jgi:cytochrome c
MISSLAIPRTIARGIVTLGIVTLLAAPVVQARSWASAAWQAGAPQTGEQLTKSSDCFSCHAPDHVIVGPAYNAIARKYAGQPDAASRLARRIREGGSGTWGNVRMPPHPDLKDAQTKEIVQWILSLKDMPPARAANAKTYTHTLEGGKRVTLDFPLFVEGSDRKVTKDVFHGYALYNSYCYRCHGTDATESELGPNLRHTFETGMTLRQFLAVAMVGREDKGMPSWAGFLSEEEMTSIYRYVKGRSLGLVTVGRPPSETD